MKINDEIKKELECLKELDLIIKSSDFTNTTYYKKREIISKKAVKVEKLHFLYNLKEAIINETHKEDSQRTRKMA